jgi:hypothetical protein
VSLKVHHEEAPGYDRTARFPDPLYVLGLFGQKSEVLAVKIEVDTNPPADAWLSTDRHLFAKICL